MPALHVFCVDGLIGAGKSTVIRKFGEGGGSKTYKHPILGTYHVNGDVMAVEENMDLYNSHQCLDVSILDKSLAALCHLKLMLDQHVLFHSALLKAKEHNVTVLIVERHLEINHDTFGEIARQISCKISPFDEGLLEVSTLKLRAGFEDYVADGRFLHGIIYLETSPQHAKENIILRKRQCDISYVEQRNIGEQEAANNVLLQPLLMPAFKRRNVPILKITPSYNGDSSKDLIEITDFCLSVCMNGQISNGV